ncbi:ribonuclease H-like domain-containing protein [Tanacetum coccineum]
MPSKTDLDNLFGPLYKEYYATSSPEVSDNSAANTLDNDNTSSSSSIVVEEDEAPQIVSSSAEQVASEPNSPILKENFNELVQEDVADFDGNVFYNAPPTLMFEESNSSSTYQDPSIMHEFHQKHRLSDKWTKNHPIEQVIGDPSNLLDHSWIESMQDELNQFKRLDVWELVECPIGINIIAMDVKMAFLNGPLKEEVFIHQSDGFVDPYFPNHVYRLKKALYGLKQAPKAWYDKLSSFLIEHHFTKGTAKLDADLQGTQVDQTKYHSMIGGLMYLTTSQPGIAFATFVCARYQACPIKKHLKKVKRIFRYLRQTINMGLWYSKDSGFKLIAYLDADLAGCNDDCKSTSGGIQFLGDKLVSWSSKKQACTAMSTAEAKYVSLSACCAQVISMRTQLLDYGFRYNKIPMYCDSQSEITISCNPRSVRKVPDNEDTIKFMLDTKEFTYTVDMFRVTLHFPVETHENPFVASINIQTIEAFRNTVGYQGVVDKVSAFYTKNLAQPWQTIFKVFNRCLTTRTSGHDQIKINIFQLFHAVINQKNIDYAALLWWDFMNNVFQKKEAIQYPRFIKLIIAYLMKKFPNIPQRIDEDYHSIKDVIPLEYETVFVGVDVLMNQPQPIISTQGTHRSTHRAHRTPTVSTASPQGKKRKQIIGESSSPPKSLKITIRQKQVIKGEKDDDDSKDMLEPRSHKENPEHVDDNDGREDETHQGNHRKRHKASKSSKSARGSSSKHSTKDSTTYVSKQQQQQEWDAWVEETVIDEDEVISKDETPKLITELQNVDKHVPTIFDRTRMEATLNDIFNQFKNVEEMEILRRRSIFLSLYKIHAERFPEADLEEKMNRWVHKEFKNLMKMHGYQFNIGKIHGIKECTRKIKEESKTIQKTISLITGLQNRVIWERVHDFQLGIESYQFKVNLTTPTLTFPSIEAYEPYSIVDKPNTSLIYLNNKDEKLVMYLVKIVKFYDATLERVLKEVKLMIFQSDS